MGFTESMYQFQSPNYPQSLGNESYLCTLKIQHTPTLDELIAAATADGASICDNENGGGSNTGDGGNGNGSGGNGNGNGGHGGNLGGICQVLLMVSIQIGI